MGLIIDIDEALRLRTDYNILREPLNEMLRNKQEAWERENPIDYLFVRGSIGTFQETYTSSIGFSHAFAETGDYAVGPIFNTEEGFSATFRTRTFMGGFTITQQTLEDRLVGKTKTDAQAFITRWLGDTVEYCMAAIQSGFGQVVEWGSDGPNGNGGVSRLLLNSADTVDGDIMNPVKNPLFTNKHTIVKRRGMTSTDINNALQSNCFYADIDLTGNDPGKIAKLADVINQVCTFMENYKDDNGKRAGVLGEKTIVCANDPHLKAALNTAVSLEMFNDMGQRQGLNPGYNRAKVKDTPYLLDIPATGQKTSANGASIGSGFFIVDRSYNAENHGPELTERVAFTLKVKEATEAPFGIKYQGRQRWDINVASWRGIAYVYLGNPTTDGITWADPANFTEVIPTDTIVKPVTVVGTVATQEVEPTEMAKIDFAANGGTGARADIVAAVGSTVILPNSTGLTPPTGKVFAGWDESAAAVSPEYEAGDEYVLEENVVLYAIWVNE
jgi:hypothetical protein